MCAARYRSCVAGCPEPYIVVPGNLRARTRRVTRLGVATARDAAAEGATHLVVGRPVLQAAVRP